MPEASVAYQEDSSLADNSPLLGDYPVAESGYDEMFAAPGLLRPHWGDMAQTLEGIGGVELERQQSEIQRLLQSDGVTTIPTTIPRFVCGIGWSTPFRC